MEHEHDDPGERREEHGGDELHGRNGKEAIEGDRRERRLLQITPGPSPQPSRWRGVVARVARGVGDLLSWALTHLTSPAVTPALIGLAVYAWMNWGALRVLPFDGRTDGKELAATLGRTLEAVHDGARAGVDEGIDEFRCATSQVPDVNIPGTSISIASLIGFMGETRVQGAVVTDPDKKVRVKLRVSGPGVSEAVETDPAATVDEAVTDAAERLYALLRPVNGAYYYFSRYPDRALVALERALEEKPPRESVHRAWGLALRNLGDSEGAIEEFEHAMTLAATGAERARLLVEMGYAAGAAKDWAHASEYFERASREDSDWPVPALRLADALREGGAPGPALAIYERVGAAEATLPDPWAAAGRIHTAEGRPELALQAYRRAQRVAFEAPARASLLRDVGDALFALDCPIEAASRYAEAMKLDERYDLSGQVAGRACPNEMVIYGEPPTCAAYPGTSGSARAAERLVGRADHVHRSSRRRPKDAAARRTAKPA